LSCKRSFSEATFLPEYRQKKRDVNTQINWLLNSSVSLRRTAKMLGVSRRMISRRLMFLGEQARLAHERELQTQTLLPQTQIAEVQFDEMETFEHTKLKPLSIGLMVDANTRKILGVSLAQMPANGPLAELSRQKYGRRKDARPAMARRLLEGLKPVICPKARITTDQNPKYPGWIHPYFPESKHVAHKGRRGCVVGQGELKKIGFDPLFSLNHTAAMLRANINRLARKTWCTTKKPENLLAHLWLYLRFHNTTIILQKQVRTA
jgi:hypothetical protein